MAVLHRTGEFRTDGITNCEYLTRSPQPARAALESVFPLVWVCVVF